MKNLFQCWLLFMIITINIAAQSPGAKWFEVIKTDSQSVYIDTTNIKHIDNQITIVNLTLFNKPQFITLYNKEAKSIKSQILFNISTKKFTTLGKLFYDDRLRIIGESSLAGVSLGNDAFATPIDSNKVMKELYSVGLKFLSIDTTVYAKPIDKENKIQGLIDNLNIQDQQTQIPLDSNKFIAKEKPNKRVEYLDNETAKPSTIKSPDVTPNLDYNISSEKNIRGMIFSDGNKYCFQVSSWKNKSKAEYEIVRLKNEGYNAFVVEAYLPNKGGTWYRIRIGYFNSLEETENYFNRFR